MYCLYNIYIRFTYGKLILKNCNQVLSLAFVFFYALQIELFYLIEADGY
jgi:hypothetical protein